jgi:5-methylcytosine-specific restriction endonuclease McrA
MRKIEYINFEKLKKDNDILTYADLLTTTEWKEKREIIIKRDNLKCACCGKKENKIDELDGYRDMTEKERSEFLKNAKEEFLKSESGQSWMKIIGGLPKFGVPMVKKENYVEQNSVILNVHHKYYIKDKKPWEYKNEALITVCSKCHTDIHNSEKIIIYDNENFVNPITVEKCWKCNGTGYLDQFHYFMSGICFACKGNGTLE